MKDKLLIIGASGHGKVIADIALRTNYKEIVFLDDNSAIKYCGRYKCIGKTDLYKELKEKYDVIVGIGNPFVRERFLNEIIFAGCTVPTLIHPKAVLGQNVVIDIGTVVMAGAVINSDTVVGKGCIINTCASCDHDNKIEDFAHISVGAHLAGTVTVGRRTWIGIGASVSNNVIIYTDCIIGAGAVVIKNIDESGTYVGVPARRK